MKIKDDPPVLQVETTPERGGSFPTTRRIVRRSIDRSRDAAELELWAAEKKITLGDMVPDCDRLEVLQTLWTYRDIESTGIEDMGPPTDLILHRTRIKEGTPIYKAKAKRLSPDKEWWLRKLVSDGMKSGMYERTTVANGKLSQWGADAVLVKKEGKVEPRLTFNYHYVFEEPPGNQMELSSRAHGFLSLPSHGVYSAFDLKNAYWATEIHPEDRHFLAFVVPGIGQVQPTRMAQGARSSSFTMNELGNIAFGEIPGPQPEISFLHSEDPEQPPHMTFYVDDIFPAHASWTNHWSFIKDHLLPRLSWARLKLSFSKIRIGSSKILALGEVHEAGGKITIKPERVQRILDWPEPGEQGTATDVRAFLGTAITARRWIKGYAEIVRPLSRLTGKVDWRWEEAERLAFQLIKNKAATAVALHGWDPALPCVAHIDASAFAGGLYVTQKQGDAVVPIMYDSFTFSKTERNYSTYKRELRAMVYFCTKHSHMFMGSKTSEVRTDHRPLTGFLNSDTHEDIYARWLEKLRPLNIKISYIPGRENVVADALSRTLFDEGCTATTLAKKLLSEADGHDQAGDHEWFWKTGKGGYEDMLKAMSSEQIQRILGEEVTEVNSGWVTFGEPQVEEEAFMEPPVEVLMANTRPKRNLKKVNFEEPAPSEEEEAEGPESPRSGNPSPSSPPPPKKRGRPKGKEKAAPPPPSSESEEEFQPSAEDAEDMDSASAEDLDQDQSGAADEEDQGNDGDQLLPNDLDHATEPLAQLSDLEDGNFTSTPEQDQIRATWYEDLEGYYRDQRVPEHWTRAQHDKFKRLAKSFRWDARLGRLIHKVGEHWVQCIGPHEIAPLLHTTHDRQGHFSNKIILEKLRYRVYWPQMSRDVRTYIDSCIPCLTWANSKTSQELSPMDALGPFAVLCIDALGPFPPTSRGNKRIINIVDPFTRFCIPKAVQSLKEEHVVPAVEEVFNMYAIPVAAYTDHGSEFKSIAFARMLGQYGTVLQFTPVGAHRAGGLVESSNRIIRRAIEKTLPLIAGNEVGDVRLDPTDWDLKLPRIASAVNARHIEQLGYSPVELLFGLVPGEFLGREHLFPRPDREETVKLVQSENFEQKMEHISPPAIIQRLADLDVSRNTAHERSEESKHDRKEKFDLKLKRQRLVAGDTVYRDQPIENRDRKKSVVPKWKGPYQIHGPVGEHRASFRIQNLDGKVLPGIYHGDQLKKVVPREGYLITGREPNLPYPRLIGDRAITRDRGRKFMERLQKDPEKWEDFTTKRRRKAQAQRARNAEANPRPDKGGTEMAGKRIGIKDHWEDPEKRRRELSKYEERRAARTATEGTAAEKAQRAGVDRFRSACTPEEDELILREVKKGTARIDIARMLPLRTINTVANRIKALRKEGRIPPVPTEWTAEQDRQLFDLLDQRKLGPKHGNLETSNDLKEIALLLQPERTSNALYGHLRKVRAKEKAKASKK